MNCKDCKFSMSEASRNALYCRLFPPYNEHFPQVRPEWFCYQFEARPTPEPEPEPEPVKTKKRTLRRSKAK